MSKAFGKVCTHGQLERSCFTCEAEETIAALRSEIAEARRLLVLVVAGETLRVTGEDARAFLARTDKETP